jgi:tRNA uridine 5-carbamoylmethylation protein Kti12
MNHSVHNDAIVLLVCGVPACGKSTLVKAIVKAYSSESFESAVVVNHMEYDEIYHEILRSNANNNHDKKKKKDSFVTNSSETPTEFVAEDGHPLETEHSDGRIAWRESRGVVLHRVQQWLSHQKDSNARTRVLILDDNFYLKSMRKQVYRVCSNFVEQHRPSMHLYLGTIYLHAPLSVCLQRNAQRPAPLPTTTIERLVERFEVPNVQNPWESALLSLATLETASEDLVEPVQQFLSTIVENAAALVVPRTEEEVEMAPPCIPTVRQQADLFWRQCVGSVAQRSRSKVSVANRVRKYCLQQPLLEGSTPRHWWSLFLQGLPEEQYPWLTPEEQEYIAQDLPQTP